MDEAIQWIIVAAFWLIATAVRKAREKQRGENAPDTTPAPQAIGFDARPEQQQVLALVAHVQSVQQWLRTLPAENQWPLPLFDLVVEPEVNRMVWQTEILVQEPTYEGVNALQRQRQRLTKFVYTVTEEAHDWARGAKPEIWLGQEILDANPSLYSELSEMLGARPTLDILQEVNLTRRELRHVYALWAPLLFSDVITALITPRRAETALLAIEQTANIHRTHGNHPPLLVRGHVLADTLGIPFRPMITNKDLVIQLNNEQYALPAATVIQDTLELSRRFVSHPLAGLNDQSPNDLVRRPVTETAPKPQHITNTKSQPTRALVPVDPVKLTNVASNAYAFRKRRSGNRSGLRKLAREAILMDEVYRI